MALNSAPSDNKNQCPRVSRSSQHDSTFRVSELDQLDLAKKDFSIMHFASSQTVRGSFHLLCVLVDFCGALAAEFSHEYETRTPKHAFGGKLDRNKSRKFCEPMDQLAL